MEKNVSLETGKEGDCAFLLARYQAVIDQTRRIFFWGTLVGLAVALVAIALDLGAVEITKFKVGDTEITLKNFFFIRLFLTSASIGALVSLYLVAAFQNRAEGVINYLAEKHKYTKAVMINDFDSWYKKTSDFKFLDGLRSTLRVSVVFLLGFLPLCAFVISIFRN
jgi:hypothetical protein